MKKNLLLVAAITISSYTWAQQDSAFRSLDEVIITANRIEQKQSQTGKVVTVIGKETLNKSQGKTLSQLLNEQAGITINGALNHMGSVQTVYMRGANSGRALILIDGLPVSDPSNINNEFNLNLIQLNEVERIEIARGAQSTLYGSDAVTGVINIITAKKDIYKPLHVSAGVSIGNLGFLRSNVSLFGTQNKWEYQLRTAVTNTNGFSAAEDTTGRGSYDADGFKGRSLSASLKRNINDQLSVRGFIQFNQYKTSLDNAGFTDDGDFTQKDQNLNTGAGFVWKKEGFNLTGNYIHGRTIRIFRDDSTSVGGFSKFVTDDYNSRSHYAEIFSSVTLHPRVILLGGYDIRFTASRNQYFSLSDFGPYSNAFNDTSMRQESLYASLIYHDENKKLNLEAGARINSNSRYGSNYTYTFNPSYAVSEKFQFFGSVATGFKTPSLYQLYAGFGGNNKLKPEESINYEVGVRLSAKHLRQRVVYFMRKVNQGLDFDYVNFIYYNIPNQKANGIEYEISWQPLKNIDVTGNASWLSGKEFVQSRVTTKDTTYSYLLRRPAFQCNLQAGWRIKNNWYASVHAKYVSSRNDVGGYQAADVPLRDYVLMSAYFSYQHKRGKVFVDLQNFTQTKFNDLSGFNSIPFIIQTGIQVEW